MKRRTAAAIFAVFALWSTPALAWDPFREDIPERSEPDRELDPAPFIAPPPGLYYVTDTYVADVVTSTGPLSSRSAGSTAWAATMLTRSRAAMSQVFMTDQAV